MQRPGGETACHLRDHRESIARGLGRGELEALKLASSAGAGLQMEVPTGLGKQ